MNANATIAPLGAGLGYRREIHDGLMAARSEVDFLEIITEKYISASRRGKDQLVELAEDFTLIPHGVSLSVGSARPVSKTFLRGVKEICGLVDPPYYSDHLAVTQSAGIDIGHLSPIAYTEATLRHVVDNVNQVQDYLQLPFVIENITETHLIPGSTMPAPAFLCEVVRQTGCGMLLDITNLYTNSVNHGFDALAYAHQLPLKAVVQVHLAGGVWHNDVLLDSHSQAVPEQVWELFACLRPAMHLKGAIVERDDNYPAFDALLDEVRMARSVMSGQRSAHLFDALAEISG
ncbi:DUF692 domain-containing protein [Burkholderia sp. Bp9126]|nr:DUF692 domain-containing protein [Burkholderia sp. Bp9126]